MSRKEIVGLFVTVTIFTIGLAVLLLLKQIDTAQAIQLIITFVLVLVTVAYVKRTADIAEATKDQADASVVMAEEMREQRRPIVVVEVVPFKVVTPYSEKTDSTRDDIFNIRNIGNGPAIELEIVLLDKEKSRPQIQKEAVFSQADKPIEFYPVDLADREKTTCYLLCQYRSVLSANVRQIWYETWLPFEPVKSKSGDKIIIRSKELEFREGFEKKSY